MWLILKSKKEILKEKETVYKLTSTHKEIAEGPEVPGPDTCTFTDVNNSEHTHTVTFHDPAVCTDGSSEGSVYYEGRFVIRNLRYFIHK